MQGKAKAEITLNEAAEMLGKSVQAVMKQAARHGVKKLANGKYNTAKLMAAARNGAMMDKQRIAGANPRKKKPADDSENDADLLIQKLQQQVRKLTADADTAEHHLARLRGEVIPETEHRERVMAIVQACRQTIDSWIKTTAAEVGNSEIKRKLEDARRKAYAATEAEHE